MGVLGKVVGRVTGGIFSGGTIGSLLGAGIGYGLGGGLLGAGIGASILGNAGANADANKANEDAIRLQNEYNYQLWQAQNEYNTPANQVARLREAGLNPNLIYGNGSASTGNATSAPRMEAYQYTANKAFDLANLYLSLKNAKDQNANLNAQTENIKSQTEAHQTHTSYEKAVLDFYVKHGYFPGQTNALPNVVNEVYNKGSQLGPHLVHQASAVKELIGNKVSQYVDSMGRAEIKAEHAADKRGLRGAARSRYIDQFIKFYNQSH